jgi:glycosyltransferase involved in cell wall biosynthesis
MDCAVIIPTRNRPDCLTRCLGGLIEANCVVVVDHASSGDAQRQNARVCCEAVEVDYVQNSHQLGAAASRNARVCRFV